MTTNAQPAPADATSAPANAGPIARPVLNVRLDSATAWENSRGGTRSGWMACHAGPISAVPTPRANVRPSRVAGVTWSVIVSAASTPAHTSIQACVAMRSSRRSKMSASAPAGRPSRSSGSRLAVWINATSVGDGVRSPISHAAATVWKNVPMFDPSCAANSAAKTLWRSGAQGERRADRTSASVTAVIVARSSWSSAVVATGACR